jgi:hypothetical protein
MLSRLGRVACRLPTTHTRSRTLVKQYTACSGLRTRLCTIASSSCWGPRWVPPPATIASTCRQAAAEHRVDRE